MVKVCNLDCLPCVLYTTGHHYGADILGPAHGYTMIMKLRQLTPVEGGSVVEWLACWTQAQKGPGSNRSRDAVG